MTLDRYQTSETEPGAFPTAEWFAALQDGLSGPLGAVLDVGCAEGVMAVLAARAGAVTVLGVDHNADRIAVCPPTPGVTFWEADSSQVVWRYDTIILSMVAHWVGAAETRRLASLAERNVAVIFRLANDGYAPENGSWFPTFDELDATVGGVRTSERRLLTQDNGKEVWAATYRTDLAIRDGMVWKGGRATPYRDGFDLHGDRPFRPTHGRPVMMLSGPNADAVRALVRNVAEAALADGTYPSDLSPRNVIVSGDQAWLIDDEPAERMPGTVVAPEYLPIWQATLSSIGLAFDGDLRSLL
jgi:hypothetical protein